MKSNKLRIGTFLLAVTILFGSLAGIAFANSDSSQTSVADDLFKSFTAKLAANLGLNQEKVSTAIDTTKKQMLAEAVKEGQITQEQADKMAENPNFPGFGFHGKKGKMGPKGFGQDYAAKVLGITVEELQAELQSGKKMQELIAERGFTAEQFKQKMLELKKDAIAKNVESGKITQEQADQILERMEQHSGSGKMFFGGRKQIRN